MTDFEAARMFEQLEAWKLKRFGTPNQNFWLDSVNINLQSS